MAQALRWTWLACRACLAKHMALLNDLDASELYVFYGEEPVSHAPRFVTLQDLQDQQQLLDIVGMAFVGPDLPVGDVGIRIMEGSPGAKNSKPDQQGIWRYTFAPVDLLTDEEKVSGNSMKKLPAEISGSPAEAAKNVVPSLRCFNFPHLDAENTMGQPTEPKEVKRRRQLWTASKNPIGRQILETLAPRLANLRTASICGYNTFQDTDSLNPFCDNVSM
ncbi:hypothetical protein AAL_06174 [Moelleriella libera RCEF 2490]|uniref:Uncharacterized protein n=1 Tax=Moelleriella libera RCEF 2490 TaxID=1081109 RepID=A0A167ZED2_9HYPO|nr:hypothetical protein AAL_06174 [Moelleriella libera RCEF 2490]